jgi:hypothetical protein
MRGVDATPESLLEVSLAFEIDATASFVITHVGYDFIGQSGQFLAHYNQAGPVVRGKSAIP